MDFIEAAKFIKDVGFPVAVAGFVLWRVDKTLRELVAELRAFHVRMGDMLTTTSALEDQVRAQADRVIHELALMVRKP